MLTLGTPRTRTATKLMLLGSGELGKEVAIELQRLGCEVIACDRYADAPAMQVAHTAHVLPMLDGAALRKVIEAERPDFIVPEIEAIATETLLELEAEGFNVIPTARAARLTMDREGIRRLAAEELGLATSPYRFASTEAEYQAAVREIGAPCLVKPVMSSSGKGQSLVRALGDVDAAWRYAQEGGRAGGKGRVIVEGFIDFEYEITLLTVRHAGGTTFCEPIGHRQVEGDYRESWQPQPMSPKALEEARRRWPAWSPARWAATVSSASSCSCSRDQVWFSEVSPRPHDTGMVTMISQDLSQFALHVRAILGLPIPNIRQRGAAASYVVLADGDSDAPSYSNLEAALAEADTQLRLFGKPEVHGHRRMGVALALAEGIEAARAKAARAAAAVTIKLQRHRLPLAARYLDAIGREDGQVHVALAGRPGHHLHHHADHAAVAGAQPEAALQRLASDVHLAHVARQIGTDLDQPGRHQILARHAGVGAAGHELRERLVGDDDVAVDVDRGQRHWRQVEHRGRGDRAALGRRGRGHLDEGRALAAPAQHVHQGADLVQHRRHVLLAVGGILGQRLQMTRASARSSICSPRTTDGSGGMCCTWPSRTSSILPENGVRPASRA